MSYAISKKDSPYYDPDFPEPIQMGRCKKFPAAEIRAWIEKKKRRSQGPNQTAYVPERGSKGTKRDRAAELSIQVDALSPLLVEKAKSGRLITYQDAMNHLRLWPDIPADLSLFEEVLAEVSMQSYKESKTLLTAVVSEFKRFAKPLPSFFELAAKLGYDGLDSPDNFVHEQRKCLWLLHNKLPEGKSLSVLCGRGFNILSAK